MTEKDYLLLALLRSIASEYAVITSEPETEIMIASTSDSRSMELYESPGLSYITFKQA